MPPSFNRNQEIQKVQKPLLKQVHRNILGILTKMLAVHGEILKQLMADGYDRKVLNATAIMDCKEALHLQFGSVILPEGERKLLRFRYEPTDTALKLFEGIENPVSQLFYSGQANLTDNEGDVHDIPAYLKDIDKDGYKAIQLECAYSLNEDGDDFENLVPDRARIEVIPENFLHKACFELGQTSDQLCGGILAKLPERFSGHVIKRLNLTQENEHKLVQSLITQAGLSAKCVLN